MTLEHLKQTATQDEARSLAIEWQNWASEQTLSYCELVEWQDAFAELASRYNLIEEFKENGII